MSTHVDRKRITIPQIRSMKGRGSIVSLTAYTTPMAQLMDEFVDLIIVGDSTGMVAYGFNSTMSVTLDMMINHGAAVTRGVSKACVIVDMPFGTFQESPQQAYRNAARVLVETQAQGVKMEGGEELLETVDFLVRRGIPVMPHIGLTPQHANVQGGFKAQIRTEEEINAFIKLGRAFEDAGAFALLVEGAFEEAARKVTAAVSIPTVGIGASPECDGQVLVTEDILGLFSGYTPKFAKRYVDLSQPIKEAFSRYAHEVRSGEFPAMEHCFGVRKNSEGG
ncbi:3-methyl-2-oxobutanoate hydroxymethyltransferase [Hahella sp. HN01]|uniref:3-methyl-2-oxobutanoate hydroxymethyltransferase n=1 Tax=Hahella sp. HN01 TaxID=2847262 RepID=UPI001C1EF5FA|nr:3-methyl-2-oxobutanoate hydroxymethyltransferase [Hahella sp. HN01]MBU6955350.1 3-methyl-2-oxobutanoate hydroxymethyltransferase [Hahella sp. HN01]